VLQRIADVVSRLVSLYPFVTLIALFVSGILFWGAFNWSLELSNTESFCISCHVMRDNIYAEYKKSIHYQNASGVRATCPDCHVPKEWKDKVVRKIGATNELFHWMAGSINTREKFIGKRMQLAGYVWSTMEANNSLECRNCHELNYMNNSVRRNNYAHQRALQSDMTCIDCHKGIAHLLPEEYLETEHARFEQDGTKCDNCHANLSYRDEEWGW
jgi:cytochrome c-type protein NapC